MINKLVSYLAEQSIVTALINNGNGFDVVAGLIWGVEGIEKVPKYGNVLFYQVNGTRYGVRVANNSKHDIEWYYEQLKTLMKGAKGHHVGLTDGLNVWVKKGELKIVFKGNA